MPLSLTTPLNVGAFDTTNYTHVKILRFVHDSANSAIHIVAYHGTLSGGVFTPGKEMDGVTLKRFEVIGAGYTTLVGKLTSASGVAIYNEVARELYQWLLDNNHYVGTIV
jgi:hypothetical protein